MSHPKGGTYKDQLYQLPSHKQKLQKWNTHVKHGEVEFGWLIPANAVA